MAWSRQNAAMAKRHLVLLATGLALVALGVGFAIVGLDTADRLASTVGALAGVAGCGFSVWAWLAGRPSPAGPAAPVNRPATDPATASVAPTAPTQARIEIADARGVQIGDGNTQHNTFS